MSDEREICQCCEYPAANMEEAIYRNDQGEKVDYLFCAVCGNAFLHRAITCPRQYGDQQPLWASIGYVANMILDAIEKRDARERE